MSQERPLRILAEEVARKIAAGEVIERPASVVRELLDNAIDSGATEISLSLSDGGIGEIRVTDNGSGMTREDLEILGTAHSTSKIRTEDDLLTVSSLGFRGEALSSIQAVARLEITTSTGTGAAWRLVQSPGMTRAITAVPGNKGTSVSVSDIFHSYPARMQFMKSGGTEGAMCARTFEEKAAAWPDRGFTLEKDGRTAARYASSSSKERVIAVAKPKEPDSWFGELRTSGPGFTATIVAGTHEVVRRDRSDSAVFVNGRKIQDFGLVQALAYAYEGFLPGGQHPFAWLFLSMDPALVDFNIHPAKKEARFRDVQPVRNAVIASVKAFLSGSPSRSRATATETPGEEGDLWRAGVPDGRSDDGERKSSSLPFHAERGSAGRILEVADSAGAMYRSLKDSERSQGPGFVYLGQAFGCFLLAEREDGLWFVDQHAAHERVIYDSLVAKGSPRQELLVPFSFDTEDDSQEAFLESSLGIAEKAGYALEKSGHRSWLVTAVPSMILRAEDAFAGLLEAWRTGEGFERELWATMACKAAVKDGDTLDPAAAMELIGKAFALAEPRCPHGRPVAFKVTKADAFARVRRTIF